MKRIVLITLACGFLFSTSTALADWGTSKKISWTADSSDVPAIAIGPGGVLHVVWQDLTPGNWEIYCRRSPDGGMSWNAAKRITWTPGDSFAPDVAADSGSIVHAVWSDNTPGNYEIYYRKSPDGGTTWGTARRLTWTAGSSSSPAIAMDADNVLHVVWDDMTSGAASIYYKRSTDKGNTWSVSKKLTSSSGNSMRPALVIDSSKTLHAAWWDDTPGNPEIYHKRSTDGGSTWSAAQRLTWTSGKSYDPAIAAGPGQTLFVVWDDDTPGNYEILAKRSTDGGATWGASQRLSWSSLESLAPDIAIDAGNAIHVVWSDYTPGNPELYYRESSNGGSTWSAAQRISWTAEDSASPAILADSGGTLHLVWEDFTPGNYEIFYKKGN
jgi:BNR repeat-like domain